MKVLVGTFNQEKALVEAFSVIVQLHRLIDDPDSVALNGQPSSYSIYFEELCKYSDAKVQFTGTDIRMNWVSS